MQYALLSDIWGESYQKNSQSVRLAVPTPIIPGRYKQTFTQENTGDDELKESIDAVYKQAGFKAALSILPPGMVRDLEAYFSKDVSYNPFASFSMTQDNLIALLLLGIVFLVLYDAFKRVA